jgi:hypothetical protein
MAGIPFALAQFHHINRQGGSLCADSPDTFGSSGLCAGRSNCEASIRPPQ